MQLFPELQLASNLQPLFCEFLVMQPHCGTLVMQRGRPPQSAARGRAHVAAAHPELALSGTIPDDVEVPENSSSGTLLTRLRSVCMLSHLRIVCRVRGIILALRLVAPPH